jgi:NUMOD4 motif
MTQILEDKMSKEQWKPIANFEGYAVSNMGRIRHNTRVLKQFYRSGYLAVNLYHAEQMTKHSVHVLVARAFVPNPKHLPEVNHVDGIKSHCQSGNLEWRTHAGNMQHAAHNNLQDDGVSFDKARNRWKVSFRAGGQRQFVGRYTTYAQALVARKQACLEASVTI